MFSFLAIFPHSDNINWNNISCFHVFICFIIFFCQNSRFRCLPTLLLFKRRLRNWRRFFVGCCHADAVAVVVAVVAAVAVDGGADVSFIAVFMLKEFLSLLPLLLVLVLLLLLLLVMMLGLLL